MQLHLISQQKANKGNTINVPVFINEKGQYNRAFIDTNKIATVFGISELRNYINEQVAFNNLVRIKNRSTQSSEQTSPINARYSLSASTNKISQGKPAVNSNYMQKSFKDVGLQLMCYIAVGEGMELIVLMCLYMIHTLILSPDLVEYDRISQFIKFIVCLCTLLF